MIRLYFLCLLIDLRAAQYDEILNDGYVVIATLFTEVDIYKETPHNCTVPWLYDGFKTFKQINFHIFHTSDRTYGIYYCMEPEHYVYVVQSENDLTLTVTPERGVIGDKLFLTCSIMLTTSKIAVTVSLRIFNSKVQLAKNKNSMGIGRTKNFQVNVSSYELFETGYQTVYCEGNFETIYNRMEANSALSTNATIQTYTYIVPTNVTPDKTEVTVGGIVICQSFADPPAKHVWSCLGGEWSSNGARLTLNALGELNCSCSAINVLKGVSHEITWNGTIRVISVGICSSTPTPQLYIAILFLASNQI